MAQSAENYPPPHTHTHLRQSQLTGFIQAGGGKEEMYRCV